MAIGSQLSDRVVEVQTAGRVGRVFYLHWPCSRPGVGQMNSGLAPTYLGVRREGVDRSTNFPSRYVRFGLFQMDLQRQQLFKNGSRVKLQGKVCEALLALLEKPGEVVSREALRTRLWPSETHVNYDANVNTTVNKLRHVLGDSPEEPAFVETIPRRGYSFVARVEYVANPVEAISPREAGVEPASGFRSIAPPAGLLERMGGAKTWFTIAVVVLVIAGILFGAAAALFSHRPY